MRTGKEPTTARSPLRMRLWLSLWGLAWAVFGVTAFAVNGRTGWAVACGVLLALILVDLCVVVYRLRRGGQPGRSGPDPPDRP
ncbi:DUF6343 family protein [Streptomyces sp. NPDC006976]|uniref:DUF6343 family protein n=1 Tax=Streptomyces castrisilvae TaxID=3033811 RepID=A0ABY9HI09_9ACTN|nr:MULTISPECIES: DUF6343 family protein [unclassified Streptomyces]MYY06283.1 hypothetical protein [Streptomyces sp. SID4913]WLQ33211.1 DUF6343 family protein [Streptomyces sp. Mut1]